MIGRRKVTVRKVRSRPRSRAAYGVSTSRRRKR